VTATEGNLNNSIGVPLTLLKVNDQTQIAVVEMGASHPGDIKELVDIACPNFGLITNVGKAHLLGFGSFEGVKATKGELYDYLRRTADKAFINVDNPHLCQMASDRNMQHDPERSESLLIPYGLEYQGAKVLPSSAEEPFLRIELDGRVINTNLVGSYNADNVMAAIAVGKQFGVTLEEAVKAIEAYVPSNNRSQMTKTAKNTLIIDAYNANPTSMAAALENFSNVSAECKVAMLGDMLELGADSLAEHASVIRSVASRSFAQTFFVGNEFIAASEALKADAEESADQLEGMIFFATSDELAQYLTTHPLEGATILIKGSRGTRMEKVISSL
jgi:UDP-N-acetylmuramoyl-tripeptide--D-alanyl-D-alanine ligase